MKNKCCKDCEGYDLGWCVWKAKRTGERSRACGWYKNELSRDMDVAERKRRNGSKDDLADRDTDVAERKGKKPRKENKK